MLTQYFIRMGNPPQPVTISTSWEPLAITGGTDIELPHKGRWPTRASCPGLTTSAYTSTTWKNLHVRSATAEEASRIELPANRPVVEITETSA